MFKQSQADYIQLHSFVASVYAKVIVLVSQDVSQSTAASSAACRLCRPPSSLVRGRSWRCVTLSGYHRSHTFHCLSEPITSNTCHSSPVLSRNGSGQDNNQWRQWLLGKVETGKSICGIIYQWAVDHHSQLPVFTPSTWHLPLPQHPSRVAFEI